MNKQISVSNTPIYIHIVSIFFGGIFLMVVSGSVLRWINDVIVAFDIQPVINIVRIIFLIGTLLAMLLALNRSKKFSYEATTEGLIVSNGGLRGRNKLYLYRDIRAISIKRGMLGKSQHYGDILLMFNGAPTDMRLILKNIDHPDDVVVLINQHCGITAGV